MKYKIIEFAKSIGFDDAGLSKSIRFDAIENLIRSRIINHKQTHFESTDIEKRINPSLLLEGSKTFLCCILSYNTIYDDNNSKIISSSTYGQDYHLLIRTMLLKLANKIKTILPEIKYEVAVDTSSLIDRYVAFISGMGDYGKNSSIIHPVFGSKIFIGYIMIDHDFELEDPYLLPTSTCGDCNICMDACPTGAINNNYTIDACKCVSYLSQNRKSVVDTLKNKYTLFGCDICTDVCPRNIKNRIDRNEFIPTYNQKFPDVNEIMNLSNKQIIDRYKNTNMLWQGPAVIRRNAIIINSIKTT